LPTLVRAKQKTTQANCQSNLRQIGLALQIYADANREFLPGPSVALVNSAYNVYSTNQLAWFIAERLGSPPPSADLKVATVLLCPAQRLALANVSAATGGADYMLNQGLNPGQPRSGPPFGRPAPPVLLSMKLSTVTASAAPASYVAMADADKGNVNATLPGWNGLPYQPAHGKVRNQLFFDWHVAPKRW
jgi:prepilin-type processing-associated H-X9-DG protein